MPLIINEVQPSEIILKVMSNGKEKDTTFLKKLNFNDVKNVWLGATEGLVYTGLDANGQTTTIDADIVAYMVGDNTTTDGNGYIGTDTDIVIPATYNGKPVTTIGRYAFTNKNELTSINISASVTNIGRFAFGYCRNAEIIFDKNSKILSIGAFAFSVCKGLKNIYLGEGLNSINTSAFESCGLVEIKIPSTVTTISNNIFTDCSDLVKIEVADGNKAYKDDNNRSLLTKDGKNLIAYANKSGTTYEIPESVATINGFAFSACNNLTDVKLPEGLITIATNAFRVCNGLTSITIPSTVTSIETHAFAYCSNLTEITLLSPTPPTLANTSAISTATTTIYVPTASLEAYQTATNWSEFAGIIKTLGNWYRVWSGKLDFSRLVMSYADVSQTVNGVVAGRPTRIFGTAFYSDTPFSFVELNYDDTETGTFVVEDEHSQYMRAPTTDNTLVAHIRGGFLQRGITLYEVQQYY